MAPPINPALLAAGSAKDYRSTASPVKIDPASLETILDNLKPTEWLSGTSVHHIIRAFIPRNLLELAEISNDEDTIYRVDKLAQRLGKSSVINRPIAFLACHYQHWIATLYDPASHTLLFLDSYSGLTPAHEIKEWIRRIAQGLSSPKTGRPKRQIINIPQQPNNCDCGIYLTVSILRIVATGCGKMTDMTSFVESPIDGLFFRALFTELFEAGSPNMHRLAGAMFTRTITLKRTQEIQPSCGTATLMFTALADIMHSNTFSVTLQSGTIETRSVEDAIEKMLGLLKSLSHEMEGLVKHL